MTGFQWDWSFVASIVPQLLLGLKITVFATLTGFVAALLLGLVWTLLRLASVPVLSPLVQLFVEFVRGTPFLVQLFFLFYVLPTWGLTFTALVTGIIGLAIFNSAPVSEIYRAGIEDIPGGQWEASLTLGLPVRRVWLGIVLPQAVRTVLPMLGNVGIGMFKETAVLSTITVMELLAQAVDIGSMYFRYIEPLTMVGVFYFIVSYTLARLVRRLEFRGAART
jgi:polar amino acid transport system permease protein